MVSNDQMSYTVLVGYIQENKNEKPVRGTLAIQFSGEGYSDIIGRLI